MRKIISILAIIMLCLIAVPDVNASLNSSFLKCTSAKREISVDLFGNTLYRDSYNIRNIGNETISSIYLRIPNNAVDVTANDLLVELTVSLNKSNGSQIAAITLSYPLRGRPYNDSYSFKITYRTPPYPSISQGDSWGQYRLKTRLFENLEWIAIGRIDVSLDLPEGAVYRNSSSVSQGKVTTVGYQQTVTYLLRDVAYSQNLELTLEYEYIVFWSAFRPTLLIGFGILIIFILQFLKKHKRQAVPQTSVKNFDFMNSFIEALDERTSLLTELESLEQYLEDRRIARKRYNRRRKVIDEHLRSLDGELASLKKKMRAAGPRYTEIVDRIEVAETEIKTLRTDIDRVKVQYRSGKLSKEAYQKLIDSYEKRTNKAKSTINAAVMGVRSEIR